MSERIVDVTSFSSLHVIIDSDGAHVFITITVNEGSYIDDHLTCRLVSYHLSEDSRAHRTSDPVFLSFEVVEAAFVKKMTA